MSIIIIKPSSQHSRPQGNESFYAAYQSSLMPSRWRLRHISPVFCCRHQALRHCIYQSLKSEFQRQNTLQLMLSE